MTTLLPYWVDDAPASLVHRLERMGAEVIGIGDRRECDYFQVIYADHDQQIEVWLHKPPITLSNVKRVLLHSPEPREREPGERLVTPYPGYQPIPGSITQVLRIAIEWAEKPL